MNPHLTILLINGILALLAYTVIYPALRQRDPLRLARVGLAVLGAALGFAGLSYAGSGAVFSLIVTQTSWAGFTTVTMLLIAGPLFLLYCYRNGIRLVPRLGD